MFMNDWIFYQQYHFTNARSQWRMKTVFFSMIKYFSYLGGLKLFVFTVAAFCRFFIRLFGTGEQKLNREYFRFYDGLHATKISSK